MTRTTDQLSADHRTVLKQLRRLEKSLNEIELSDAAREHIIEVADFLGCFVRRHFEKEEEITLQ